jgi:quinol monooxygenase YgiN
MVVFIATLQVAAGKEEDFERLQTELSEISHAREPGLLVYDVIRHAEKKGTYVVYARFRDKEAFEFHHWYPPSWNAWKGRWICNFLTGLAD